ncbi:MAG TPA: glycosyltransferase family 4 protein [Anaerolineales bacterium]|nr:glycosyltransferase family 4 protein [Anaerolineales bacterium]
MTLRRVVIYCPDRHIVYDGSTPYRRGVGGGISARIRMARALARVGHQVTMVVNCPCRDRIDSVDYVPLDESRRLQADVLIANTSGGAMSLEPVFDLEVEADLRLGWFHGTVRPAGLEAESFDGFYAVSNFVAGVAEREWGLPRRRIFVAYNAFEEELFRAAESDAPERDLHRLVYFSHPSKGLEAAIGVMRRLRAVDRRFHLVIFGGPGLWGEAEQQMPVGEGMIWRGLVGQETLIPELVRCGFALHLQARQEPGALAIVDAMRAGCALVGSPVGCYPEMVRHGVDGILLPGDHLGPEVQDAAAEAIMGLVEDRERADALRQAAQSIPWNTDTMAEVWTQHWEARLEGRSSTSTAQAGCPLCGGFGLALRDGCHCLDCGRYSRFQTEPVCAGS